MFIRYIDKEGNEIDFNTWSELLINPSYKIIKQETLPDGKWVSTVWLGLDHAYPDHKSQIFETMVFPEKGNFDDIDKDRYSSLKEAEKGHKKMVKKYLKTNGI